MINDKVVYAGRVYSLKSSMGWFVYFKSSTNHNLMYGFPENQDTQNLDLKKNDKFILTGSEGYSSTILDYIIKELDMNTKPSLKYMEVIGAQLTSPASNTNANESIKPVEKKSIRVIVMVGQQYKECTNSYSRIIEITEIIGEGLDAQVKCKLVSSTLKSHRTSGMNLRTLLSSFNLVS